MKREVMLFVRASDEQPRDRHSLTASVREWPRQQRSSSRWHGRSVRRARRIAQLLRANGRSERDVRAFPDQPAVRARTDRARTPAWRTALPDDTEFLSTRQRASLLAWPRLVQ